MNANAICLISAALAILAGSAFAQLPHFHVAIDGNDAWSGRLVSPNAGRTDGPFATIARARDATRPMPEIDDESGLRAVVVVGRGRHFLAEPLTLGERDSGIRYAAAPGEKPALSGGRRISGFKTTPAGLWTVEIPHAKDGKWPFNELFVNGQRRPRARHPNSGYMRVNKAVDKRTSFTFNPGDIPPIQDVKAVELVFLHDWAISRVDVGQIDRNTNTLTTADRIGASELPFTTIDGFEPQPRYFLENAIEFLDAPGEWFLDAKSGTLTYKPMPGEKIETAEVIAPLLTRLLTIDRGDFIEFIGLTFEHCLFVRPARGYAASQAGFHEARRPGEKGYWPMPSAIELSNNEFCFFVDCTIRHIGGTGIRMHPSCRWSQIKNSTISDIGGNGVMIGGQGPMPGTLQAEFCGVLQCSISDCGQRYFGCVGVWIGIADRAYVSQSRIFRMPYSGISVGWSWNVNPTGCKDNSINGNHIHHVMQTLSDGGGIYTLGHQPGTVIRGNLIHDIPANAGRAESNGMFIDEGSSQMLIKDNVIYSVARSPIRFHKATTNTIRNNTLVAPKGVPTFRFNACKEADFTFQDNKLPAAEGFVPPVPDEFFGR